MLRDGRVALWGSARWTLPTWRWACGAGPLPRNATGALATTGRRRVGQRSGAGLPVNLSKNCGHDCWRSMMASVEKRTRDGAVTWLVRWRDPDGAQRKKTFARKTDADRHLIGVESRMLSGEYVDPALARIGHADVAAWVADLSVSGLSASSVRHAHRVLSLLLALAVRDGRISRN